MKLTRHFLAEAADKGLLTPDQAESLWAFWTERTRHQPGFCFTHILFYLGGIMAIGAMTLFMTLGWERFGGYGILALAMAYSLLGLFLTEFFLKRNLTIPSGICATFVVALTPLALYGLLLGLGWNATTRPYRAYHAYIDLGWIFMELGTLVTGVIMAWRYRFPFLVMPIAATLWYMSMDLTPFFSGQEHPAWELRCLVSIWFGLIILLLGFWVDLRSRHSKDFAFWLYFFGVVSFWGGLSAQEPGTQWQQCIYLFINLGLILAGVFLARRVFVVFGAIGVSGYLGHQAYTVFNDSQVFPFVLTGIGLAVICLGILWQKYELELTQRLRSMLPPALRELCER